ncbi:NifB/NifX family molybdenum-iron cluster-binding protein [uncultured Sphaerochaeta sp.]|uniref:NifB/NifX family molybdenum-iron cluster-binding protein n=1 Tax=uncultured Sphaerochaeta sp. TaxID=886478 RepID=UPI002A0A5C67|nr:NifB/NifX family molybdenum-iron cluster-binding protein [uncultured Sphaerochaeta sp.]
MIVAVPAEEKSLDSAICVSFGRAPIYCIYDTEKETSTFLDNKAAEASGGAGIQAAQFLADQKIDSLITFRLGENASKVLSAANISILKALNLSIADNIANLLEGKLTALNEVHPGYHHAH